MKKLLSVAGNTTRSLSAPAFSILLSIYVIRYSDSLVWGQFVESMIIIGLFAQFLNWGYKDLLLRSFSQTPAIIPQLFMENFLSRCALLPLPLALLFIISGDVSHIYWLSLWLLLLFCYQSLEVFVIYKKSFLTQTLAEAAGFVTTLAGLYYTVEIPTYNSILQWFTIGISVKFFILFLGLKDTFRVKFPVSPDWTFFRKGLPFFLIGLSSMLISKADLYIVGLFTEPEALGHYQVIVTIFLYLQATSNFIATPFIKPLYRVNEAAWQNFRKRFRLWGVIICLLAMPVIYFVLQMVYNFTLEWEFYLYGFLMALPVFLYAPSILMLFRQGMEQRVLWINFVVATISAILTWWLIRPMGIKGALLAAAIVQWVLVIIYKFLRVKSAETGTMQSAS